MADKEKVTLTLPKAVMDAVRREAPPRGYSRFIAEAVDYFVKEKDRRALRERLIDGYRATAEADQVLTEEWQLLEEEAWNRIDDSAPGQDDLP